MGIRDESNKKLADLYVHLHSTVMKIKYLNGLINSRHVGPMCSFAINSIRLKVSHEITSNTKLICKWNKLNSEMLKLQMSITLRNQFITGVANKSIPIITSMIVTDCINVLRKQFTEKELLQDQ